MWCCAKTKKIRLLARASWPFVSLNSMYIADTLLLCLCVCVFWYYFSKQVFSFGLFSSVSPHFCLFPLLIVLRILYLLVSPLFSVHVHVCTFILGMRFYWSVTIVKAQILLFSVCFEISMKNIYYKQSGCTDSCRESRENLWFIHYEQNVLLRRNPYKQFVCADQLGEQNTVRPLGYPWGSIWKLDRTLF
jgi:hypothetical protein